MPAHVKGVVERHVVVVVDQRVVCVVSTGWHLTGHNCTVWAVSGRVRSLDHVAPRCVVCFVGLNAKLNAEGTTFGVIAAAAGELVTSVCLVPGLEGSLAGVLQLVVPVVVAILLVFLGLLLHRCRLRGTLSGVRRRLSLE